MNIFRAMFSVLALAMPGFAWADPIPEVQESAVGFRTFDLPAEQTGSFEAVFDVTPLADKIDCFTGFAAAVPRNASDVAAIVRFNDSGKIDVRNGGSFVADQAVGYSANKAYRVRMVVNVATKKYSVYVTPAGQAEVQLAKDFAFRSQQANVQSLKKVVLAGYAGSDGFFTGPHRVSGFTLKAVSAP